MGTDDTARPPLDVDNDDFRDDHERAMRDHILAREHACDDLCSDDIVTRLAARLQAGNPAQDALRDEVEFLIRATDAHEWVKRDAHLRHIRAILARQAGSPVQEHSHHWVDGELLLNGCPLPHEPTPEEREAYVIDKAVQIAQSRATATGTERLPDRINVLINEWSDDEAVDWRGGVPYLVRTQVVNALRAALEAGDDR